MKNQNEYIKTETDKDNNFICLHTCVHPRCFVCLFVLSYDVLRAKVAGCPGTGSHATPPPRVSSETLEREHEYHE